MAETLDMMVMSSTGAWRTSTKPLLEDKCMNPQLEDKCMKPQLEDNKCAGTFLVETKKKKVLVDDNLPKPPLFVTKLEYFEI